MAKAAPKGADMKAVAVRSIISTSGGAVRIDIVPHT
jgi:hypothetical protein